MPASTKTADWTVEGVVLREPLSDRFPLFQGRCREHSLVAVNFYIGSRRLPLPNRVLESFPQFRNLASQSRNRESIVIDQKDLHCPY